jgi:hypothetical protein
MNPFNTSWLANLARVRNARTARWSSWDRTGRNADAWLVPPGKTATLAEIEGPGCITHIWFTQFSRYRRFEDWDTADPDFYRKVLLKIYWDDETEPSVLAPVGDFFGLGHSMAANFCSLPFSGSTREPGKFGGPCALNCYLPMPFRKFARVEITNEGEHTYGQYFYIDYEQYDEPLDEDVAYLHAQWRRENPTDGWAHDIACNHPSVNVVNLDGKGNYTILEAKGRGHYIGCNLSVTNFHDSWWGEGDDMIWVDGYKWPPDLHGTGSEDYLNQAWGMQRNAFLFNGSALYEEDHRPYQVSYVFHLTNPVHFKKQILVTIEHGHANQMCNEFASTAYWYQLEPHKAFGIPPVARRLPVRTGLGAEVVDLPGMRTPKGMTAEMRRNKKRSLQKRALQAKQASAEELKRYKREQAAFRAERKRGLGDNKLRR